MSPILEVLLSVFVFVIYIIGFWTYGNGNFSFAEAVVWPMHFFAKVVVSIPMMLIRGVKEALNKTNG